MLLFVVTKPPNRTIPTFFGARDPPSFDRTAIDPKALQDTRVAGKRIPDWRHFENPDTACPPVYIEKFLSPQF